MQLTLNRSITAGLLIALLTAVTALSGEPTGFTGFRLPIWELLLQLNLCSGFVFLIVGVLESTETPLPDVRSALNMFATAFVAYGAVCAVNAASLGVPFAAKLFLFTISLACLGTGWARLAISLLQTLDAAE